MSISFHHFCRSLFFLFLLMFNHYLFSQADDAMPAEQETAVGEQSEVPHSVLRLADQQNFVALGTLLDREQHHFTVKLTHVGQDALSVKSVRSTCPCLVIKTNPAPVTLQPGEELQIAAILRANTLPSGKFSRLIMIDVQDLTPIYVKVTGEIDANVTFEPAPVIDLGSFIGIATTWQRTVKLQFKFPQNKQIQLQQPKESENFNLTLDSPAANTFVVTATPKLPLQLGRVNEVISLPTTGVEGYGPVQIALRGTVTGWNLALKEHNLIIETSKTELGKQHAAVLTVIPASKAEKRNAARRRFATFAPQTKKDSRVAEQRVDKEEQKEDELLNKIETWQEIAEKIKPVLPKGCSWEMVPEKEELKINLTFPPDFFRQRRKFSGTVHLEEKLFGRINIVGKE